MPLAGDDCKIDHVTDKRKVEACLSEPPANRAREVALGRDQPPSTNLSGVHSQGAFNSQQLRGQRFYAGAGRRSNRRPAGRPVCCLTPCLWTVGSSGGRTGDLVTSENWGAGTTLVPGASSSMSYASSAKDAVDAWDASGRIWQPSPPAGGRAVAGSNPVAPTRRKPTSEAGLGVARLSPLSPQAKARGYSCPLSLDSCVSVRRSAGGSERLIGPGIRRIDLQDF
jgi:hypothetical protein